MQAEKIIALFNKVIVTYEKETEYYLSDYTSSREQQKKEEAKIRNRIKVWKKKLAHLLTTEDK